MDAHDEEYKVLGEGLWPAEFRHLRNCQLVIWGKVKGEQTSGCALMIAILRVRCGSSVYVQKKSCSFTSSCGRDSVVSGSTRNRAALASLFDREVVTVEVETAILN